MGPPFEKEDRDIPLDSEQESFLNSFLNALSDPVFILNSNATILALNNAANDLLRSLGLDSSFDPIGNSYPNTFDETSIPLPSSVREEITAICRGESASDQLTFSTTASSDGGTVELHLDSLNLFNERYTTLVHRDHREQPEHTTGLRTEQNQQVPGDKKENGGITLDWNYLRSLMNTLPTGLCIMDEEGTIKRTNRSLRSLLGYADDELVGVDGGKIFAGNSAELDQIFAAVLREDQPINRETQLTTSGGKSVYVLLSAARLRDNNTGSHELVCAVTDISKRKQAKRKLRANKRRLSLALNVARAGIWEWDLQTDEEYWDENTERLFGLEPGQFEGTYEDFLKRVHPDDRQKLNEATDHAIETGTEFEKEFRIVRDGKENKWLMSRGEVFFDNHGNPKTMLGVTMDITERKTSQEALEEALEEKESLLREIHHRVKNNLQIINSFLSMQNRNIESKRVNKAFNESIGRVRAMAMIHEKLYQDPDLSNLDFQEYLSELVQRLTETKNLEDVDVNITVEANELDLDRGIACGIIANELITNALQHGVKGNGTDEIEIAVGQNENGEHFLRVRDNGPGFESDFDPETSKSTGLDIVHSIVDFELDGSLRFENDNGAKVTVTF